MMKRFVKPVLFACLLASFIAGGIQAEVVPIEGGGGALCTYGVGWCGDTGCEGTGGVCYMERSNTPCWCLY